MRTNRQTYARAQQLRRTMTLPEVILWQTLRQRRGLCSRFRRQHPIGPYILDFYCPAARLAIEVDGRVHDIAAQARYDARREAWLADRGIRVVRIAATDVLRDKTLKEVLLTIKTAVSTPSAGCAGTSPVNGGGSRVGYHGA